MNLLCQVQYFPKRLLNHNVVPSKALFLRVLQRQLHSLLIFGWAYSWADR